MAKPKKKRHQHPSGRVALARPGGPGGAGAAEADLRRGLAAFAGGDYGEAIHAWGQVRRVTPSPALDRALAEARFRRALAANPARQAQELQDTVGLAPERAVYHLHLGLAYQRQGQIRRAFAAYAEAHRLAPADFRIRRHLALALLDDPTGAAQARELLVGAPAADEPAARVQALAALRAGDSAGAMAVLAGRKAPSMLAALALGLAQLAAGEVEAARATLGKVQRSRRPLSAEAHQAAAVGLVAAGMRAGDLAAALKTLRGQEVPADAGLRRAFAAASRQLGLALVLDERLEDAIVAWGQARAADPDDEATRRGLSHLNEVAGTRAARQGNFGLAQQHWEAALGDQPGNGRLLRNLALAAERLGEWRGAAARWEELIRQWKKELQAVRREDGAAAELRGRLVVAHRQLAQALDSAGDTRAAARALERALDLEESDDLRLRAAELYLEGEDYSGAIGHLRRALAAHPNDVRVLLDLGVAYDRKGDERQALGYLEQALALEPENQAVKSTLASVHHERAHRLADARLREQAVAEFERAGELEPGHAEHAQCLGKLLLGLGRLDAAKAAFSRALALKPNDAALRAIIGGYYLEHGQEKEAERLFRQALRLESHPVANATIGALYLRFGNPAKAEPYFKRVLKGRDPLALTAVARALVETGRGAEGVPYLERAITINPFSFEARLGLVVELALAGDDERAIAQLLVAESMASVVNDREALAMIRKIRAKLDLPELGTLGGGLPGFGDLFAGGLR